MSFLSKQSSSQMLGAFVGIVILSLVVRMFLAGGIEEFFDPTKRVQNRIEEALKSNPGDLAVLNAVEQNFPLEYDKLLDAMKDTAVDGASDEDVTAAGRQQLAAFLGKHLNDFAAAPSASLLEVLRSEAATLEALSLENPVACSSYVFATSPPRTGISDEAKELLGKNTAAKVRAMAAGRTDQQLRLQVTPAEVEKLQRSLATLGASDTQILVLTQGLESTIVSIDPPELCDAAKLMLKAIEAQEASTRDLLIGSLLAPSA